MSVLSLRVQYPKLRNMAHYLPLNVFTASKGSNFYILSYNELKFQFHRGTRLNSRGIRSCSCTSKSPFRVTLAQNHLGSDASAQNEFFTGTHLPGAHWPIDKNALWPTLPPFERFHCCQRIKLLYFIYSFYKQRSHNVI